MESVLNDKKRIYIFSGHYGSGKSNLAVNYALMLNKCREKVALADLDIVNPYFRTKDAERLLEINGIHLICSSYANSNVDVPALSAEGYAITSDLSTSFIVDVGGDDRGALALGRYSEDIVKENNYEMFFVVNCYRPLTDTPQKALEIMREIESAAKIKFTSIINNSNLGNETTPDDIRKSFAYADELSDLSRLAIKYTGILYEMKNPPKPTVGEILPVYIFIEQRFL